MRTNLASFPLFRSASYFILTLSIVSFCLASESAFAKFPSLSDFSDNLDKLSQEESKLAKTCSILSQASTNSTNMSAKITGDNAEIASQACKVSKEVSIVANQLSLLVNASTNGSSIDSQSSGQGLAPIYSILSNQTSVLSRQTDILASMSSASLLPIFTGIGGVAAGVGAVYFAGRNASLTNKKIQEDRNARLHELTLSYLMEAINKQKNMRDKKKDPKEYHIAAFQFVTYMEALAGIAKTGSIVDLHKFDSYFLNAKEILQQKEFDPFRSNYNNLNEWKVNN